MKMQQAHESYQNLIRQISDIPSDTKKNLIPGAVGVEVNAQGIAKITAAGFADMKQRRPMTEDTLFWMASTGKTFVSMCFMMLAQEGKASLDAPVSEYLPYWKNLYRKETAADGSFRILPVQTPVTIRHLLSHTSGLEWLPGFFQYMELSYISLETQSHVYAASPLQTEPGTAYSYSNAGINTVARVIEVLSGKPFEKFLQERLLDYVGAEDTGYFPTKEQLKRLAKGFIYHPENDVYEQVDVVNQLSVLPYDAPGRHAECGGGLFSTPRDMGKTAAMIANLGNTAEGRILEESSLREICKKQTPECCPNLYGLGSQVGVVGHGGAWGTQTAVDLDCQAGAVYMIQKAGSWPKDLNNK